MVCAGAGLPARICPCTQSVPAPEPSRRTRPGRQAGTSLPCYTHYVLAVMVMLAVMLMFMPILDIHSSAHGCSLLTAWAASAAARTPFSVRLSCPGSRHRLAVITLNYAVLVSRLLSLRRPVRGRQRMRVDDAVIDRGCALVLWSKVSRGETTQTSEDTTETRQKTREGRVPQAGQRKDVSRNGRTSPARRPNVPGC